MFKLLVVLFIYLLGCATLFVFQRSLIYYPQTRAMNHPDNTLKLAIAEGELVVSTHLHEGTNAIIYFGGNAEDVSLNLPMFSTLFPKHASYLLHYRGYGGSSGTPSEHALQQDALLLFDTVYAKHRHIVIIGRSLGSGVATYVASRRPITRLVLITPFDSLQKVAAQHFPYIPTSWLLLDKYESWRYAEQLTIPTLILVAEQDEVIPRANTDRLYEHFKNGIAAFKALANTDHNTISTSPEYLPLLRDFINSSLKE